MSEKIHQIPFYHGSIRRVTEVVGTIIDNLAVQRVDADGNPGKLIRVPLSYASKQHWVWRLKEQFDESGQELAERQVNNKVVLPRITFALAGFQYNSDAKLNSLQKISRQVESKEDGEIRKWQYAPIPYVLSYRVTAFARNMDDLMQITEQILPYFRPDLSVRVAEIGPKGSGEEVYNDIPISMGGDPQFSDLREEGFERTDLVTMEFDLQANTNIWGPIREQKIILKSIVDLDQLAPNQQLQRVTVEAAPGELKDRENSTTTIEDLT